jgi:hypothetical protein
VGGEIPLKFAPASLAMAFHLASVVPWGRSFDEYRRMFALSDLDLRLRILGCADGPASFNAEAHVLGHHVVSCDPLYRFDTRQVRERIDATFHEAIEQTRRNRQSFVWQAFPSVAELERARRRAMERFLDDYEQGLNEGRYVDAELPRLPFPDNTFDLALCSHFLFLYSAHLDLTFHRQAIHEMLRVASEVRIFPLVALGGAPSPHLDAVQDALRLGGFHVSVERVDYEFQRGANQMMRVRVSTRSHRP